jgi:hypothetical protein
MTIGMNTTTLERNTNETHNNIAFSFTHGTPSEIDKPDFQQCVGGFTCTLERGSTKARAVTGKLRRPVPVSNPDTPKKGTSTSDW